VLRPHIREIEGEIQEALEDGKQALIECAQGPMLDIDYGTYPYVTSSSPSAAGACQGAGIAPTQVSRVIAVFKAYSTRVGGGPMPTELLDDTGNLIRERGREFGTSTGRPRRTGWFDGVAARHVARLNGVTEVAVTLVDVLDAFEEIQVCTGYGIDGTVTNRVPALVDDYQKAQPVYESVDGWSRDITGARVAADLPENARTYLRRLEQLIGAPVTMAGVGPAREQLVPLTDTAAILGGTVAR
jgi:adenylosuccinate synthase